MWIMVDGFGDGIFGGLRGTATKMVVCGSEESKIRAPFAGEKGRKDKSERREMKGF